ncbi:DUF2721 domain-containing protein [Leptospira bandrabouensis]|uniref:DUF2721 domain-containing protein n=1 Tax=Leptospira bandrabouensis TaxID=2484903 RepID=A0A6H3NYL1_9LEPT|nr:DUF2721 domain-containing protein [Leptospira bandrabouensis]MCG6144338.1 DUF2721 domain-containing protein [Leptospira bandrabouensis]MCG6150652.1 DUF2721 domain-containing protein [Leptospira bandrabouensis]MCG6159999.1 DUF2721 domain-containing protein [Leptospira bandrabouensis]MCG6163932.1 DUF2721 domain-containing protein [Leptospira bandrabouensis]MCW7456960.1 DUF2721 domain-containing protein [Leptospira bandrabouensis]
MDNLTYSIPGLLFPAISLLMLAYTNRFFGLAKLSRQLLSEYEKSKSEILKKQIHNLRFRISLILYAQSAGIFSLILCTCSMGMIPFYNIVAWILFASSLLFMVVSLILALIEIHLSVIALDLERNSILNTNDNLSKM